MKNTAQKDIPDFHEWRKRNPIKPQHTACLCHEKEIETGIGMMYDGMEFCPLHASAPELLAACEELILYIEGGNTLKVEMYPQSIEFAKKAIAKARGEA